MSLYVVISAGDTDRLSETVGSIFPDDFYRISDDTWVVSAKALTTRQLCEKLGITQGDDVGPNGPAVIFGLRSSYWGRYNTSLWEWLKVKLEGANA